MDEINSILNDHDNGGHPCVAPGCEYFVPYDDEPYCYKHSPDEGSSLQGYSYKQHGSNLPSGKFR